MATQIVRGKGKAFAVAAAQAANGDTDILQIHSSDGPYTMSIQILGTTTSGTISATYQAMVSNDGVNWTNWDTTLVLTAAASGTSAVKVLAAHTFQFVKLVLSGLTGTGAAVKVTVSV